VINQTFDLQNTFAVNFNPLCIGNPGPAKLFGTRKVIQLTGDIDRETGHMTINQTGKKFGIYGTDLGVSFLHDGKLYFLFGDTTRRGPDGGIPQSAMPAAPYNEDETDYDSIAYTTSDRAYDGINLIFNSDFPRVDDISQLTAEHPIEGVSIGNDMYVFFTTDLMEEGRILPRRTVLARSTDGGYNFGNSLYTFSKDKFIHVSIQIINNENIQGLPDPIGKGLLIWGSGVYRKSDVYLAYMPLDEITNRSSVRFFAGFDPGSSRPVWESNESMAKPLFSAGCIGELSIRWNYYLEKWIMLYNCGLCNTKGVIVRLADKPWGPWSTPKIVFDPADGHGRFIHQPGRDRLYDRDRDRDLPSDVGYEYGPYQMTPYATGVKGRYTKIYFTLSTWNPYQVIQMSAIITSEEEDKNPKPYANNMNDRNDRKYAYVSILLAHLAKIKNISLGNSIQNSTYIADHIEWAQFHSHLELRSELKTKFLQLITNLASDRDKADAYTAMTAAIVRLGYDYSSFNNSVNDSVYVRWALNAVHSGHKQWLIDDINEKIDNEHFLQNNDYLCYAYSSDDSNEFKYARVSLLEAKLADNVGMKWDLPFQGLLDCNSHITWARFRSVEEMREDLAYKFNQIIYKFTSPSQIAKAYEELTKVILELTDNISDFKEYSSHYEWALSMINNNKQEIIIREISKLINNEHFLTSVPTNR
jgi:hypothetical protein